MNRTTSSDEWSDSELDRTLEWLHPAEPLDPSKREAVHSLLMSTIREDMRGSAARSARSPASPPSIVGLAGASAGRQGLRSWLPALIAASLVGIGLLTPALSTELLPLPNAAGTSSAQGAATTDDSILEQWRASIAEMWHVESPPLVPAVRFVDVEDVQPLIDQCMNERGFQAMPGETGGWAIAESEKSAFDLSMYVCTVSYPPEPRTMQPLSDAQKETWYDYITTTLIPCLKGMGYEVTGVPSREVFVRTFDTTQQYSPYEGLPHHLTGSDQECPQKPPTKLLWG